MTELLKKVGRVLRRSVEPIPSTFKEHGWQPLWILLEIVCLLSRMLSLLTYLARRPGQILIQVWVGLWLLALVFLALFGPTGGWIVLAVVFYRLQDLLFSTLDDTFSVTDRFDSFDGGTKVLIALINLAQIVLIFTIAIMVLTTSSDWSNAANPLTRGNAFVFSWSSLTPFAVSASVVDTVSRTLTVVESSIAVIIVLIALSRFMGVTPSPHSRSAGVTGMLESLTEALGGTVDPAVVRTDLLKVKSRAGTTAVGGGVEANEAAAVVHLVDAVAAKINVPIDG